MVQANKKSDEQQYSKEEADERLKAALRGARLAGHKPMESMTRPKSQKKRKKRRSTSSA
jgi:hypothetical protein